MTKTAGKQRTKTKGFVSARKTFSPTNTLALSVESIFTSFPTHVLHGNILACDLVPP